MCIVARTGNSRVLMLTLSYSDIVVGNNLRSIVVDSIQNLVAEENVP